MWWVRLGLLIMVILTGLCYWALGKNVLDAEEKSNRDLSYELNPFTGEKMPTETKKKAEK